jgi:LAO/AO transport system kinase
LLKRLLKGDSRAVARLITLVENGDPEARKVIKELYRYGGGAHIIGITGSPGAGKSVLICKLTQAYRRLGKIVGIIAVDPTSPFTGGALLGDRVRMQELGGDPDVFIRSMGTRGALGGLATATNEAINILDASEKDVIIVETVGTGQDEIEIAKFAHTLVVVTMPGGGDEIQSIKAGILEVGDIFVVNKADYPETYRTIAELKFMLELGRDRKKDGWEEPVLQTCAIKNEGIDELLHKIQEHRQYLVETGQLQRKRANRLRAELVKIINRRIAEAVNEAIGEGGEHHDLVDKVALTGEIDPYSAADVIIRHLLRKGRENPASLDNAYSD